MKKVLVVALLAIALVGCGGSGGGNAANTPPTVTVSDSSIFEPASGSAALLLTVSLSKASTQAVTVDYAASAVTAASGSDFSPASGTLTFAAGETSKSISIDALADTPFDERDETLAVLLSNPVGATLASTQATATIVDKVTNPDTGITTCADETGNLLACPQTGFDQQDAEFGLDNTNNVNTDGRAGFSFTKLDSTGAVLAASAVTWDCVRDETTGLIWEIKTNDGGLRDQDNTFAWYNPDGSTNGGNAGAQTGGTCAGGISCNSAAYVNAVNTAGLCGANDWRMPTAMELLTLHDYGTVTAPGIDTGYFNDVSISTSSLTFWASDSDAADPANAWVVYETIGSAGASSVGSKSSLPSLVRLVRKP